MEDENLAPDIHVTPCHFGSVTNLEETENIFGEFSPVSCSARTSFDTGALGSYQSVEQLGVGGDPVGSALRFCSFLHEARHLHDCFGTQAGISLFSLRIEKLRMFWDLAAEFAGSKTPWQLPVTDWASNSSCPGRLKQYIRKQRFLSAYEGAFLGRGVIGNTRGRSSPRPWVELRIHKLGMSVPVCPMNLRMLGLTTNDEIVSVPEGGISSHWFLLGFEALIEGNAQALQRTLIKGFWGDAVAKRVWAQMTTYRIETRNPNVATDQVSERLTSYNLTDLLLTRYLEQRGIRSFPRDLVLKLADRALMDSGIWLVSAPWAPRVEISSNHPGAAFTRQIERTEWGEPLIDSIVEESAHLPFIDQLIAAFEQTPKIGSAEAARKLHPTQFMESFISHEIIVPLLKARRIHGDELFWNSKKYAEHAGDLPALPYVVYNKRLHSSNEVARIDELFAKKWCDYLILNAIVDQLLDGAKVICCPRAYDMYPGINHFQLAEDGCDHHIASFECMSWCPGEGDSLPNCRFAYWLRRLGFCREDA